MIISDHYSRWVKPFAWSCATAAGGYLVQSFLQPKQDQDDQPSPSLSTYVWTLAPAVLTFLIVSVKRSSTQALPAAVIPEPAQPLTESKSKPHRGTPDDLERLWLNESTNIRKSSKAWNEILRKPLDELRISSPEDRKCLELIERRIPLKSNRHFIGPCLQLLQRTALDLKEQTRPLLGIWQKCGEEIEKYAASISARFYRMTLSSLQFMAADGWQMRHDDGALNPLGKHVDGIMLKFLRFIQDCENEIAHTVAHVKERKKARAQQIKNLEEPLRDLRTVLRFLMTCSRSIQLPATLLFLRDAGFTDHDMTVVEKFREVCQIAHFGVLREKAFRDANELPFSQDIFPKFYAKLQKLMKPNGSIHFAALVDLENTLIEHSNHLNLLFVNTTLDLHRAIKGEITHEEWCRDHGPSSIKKSHGEFINSLKETGILITMYKHDIEEIFAIVERNIIDQEDRFVPNPSAQHFLGMISESKRLFKEPWQPTYVQIPDPLLHFNLHNWAEQSIGLHATKLNRIREHFELQTYGMSLIEDVCEMASDMENFDGLQWVRARRSLTELNNILSEWLAQWHKMSHDKEREVVKLLKTYPEEQKREFAEQIGQWMNEQKAAMKPVIDMLCLGAWIDSLAFDTLDPKKRDDDFSWFFPQTLKQILSSFQPEKLFAQSSPRRAVPPKLISASISVATPAGKEIQMERAAPAQRTQPKVKRRGEATRIAQAPLEGVVAEAQ